jgi:hypothetical protein
MQKVEVRSHLFHLNSKSWRWQREDRNYTKSAYLASAKLIYNWLLVSCNRVSFCNWLLASVGE